MCMKKCDLNANCARQQIKVVSVRLPCNVDQINCIRVNYLLCEVHPIYLKLNEIHSVGLTIYFKRTCQTKHFKI